MKYFRLIAVLATSSIIPAAIAQTPLDPGLAVSGAISAAHETDSYSIEAQAGDAIVIRTTRVSGNLWPRVILTDPKGQPLGDSSATTTVDVHQPVAASGVYRVTVSDGFSGTNTGAYSLYVQTVNRPGHAGALAPGVAVAGPAVPAGGFASYTLAVAPGDVIVLRCAQASGTLWPLVRLYDPYGTLIDSAFGSETADLSRIATAGGVYTVLVGDGYNGTYTGTFGLCAQLTNAPGAASAFTVGDTVSGSIGGVAVMRTYSVPAVAGDVIVARMCNTSGDLWPMIRLYNPNGLFLSEGTSGLTTDFAQPVNATGTYTMVVGDGFNAVRTGQYNLFVQKPTHPEKTQSLSQGNSIPGDITSPATMRTYTLTSPRAGYSTVVLTMTKTTGLLWPLIRVYDEFGARVKETFGTSLATLSTVLRPSRPYVVVVGDGHDGTGTGAYTLAWSFTSPDTMRVFTVVGGISAATAEDLSRLNLVNTGPSNGRIDILDAVAVARSAWGL